MAVTEQPIGDRRGEARRVHESGRRRTGCDARRGARRDRRPARPLQGDGGRRPAHLGAARRAHGHHRALRARVAQCPGGGRLRHVRPRQAELQLPPEQALALADESSPFFLCGAFQGFTSLVRDEPKIREAFTSGAGVGWHEHNHDLFEGTERFFRTGYNAQPRRSWIPALDGVEAKLRAGMRVADVGCGLGASTIIMAKAYPDSPVRRLRLPPASRSTAARERGRGGRRPIACASRSRPRAGSPGTYDLVAMFDCLHDMGDPVGAARHVRGALEQDGTWMIVEPFAGDKRRGQSQPGRPRLLRRLDARVHAGLAVAGGRARAGRAGGRGAAARRRHRRRVHALPPSHGDALQPRARGASVSTTIAGTMSRQPATRAREPDIVGLVAHDGVRIAYESFGEGEHTILLPAELADRQPAAVEAAGAVSRPPLPRRHVRPARQRRGDRPADAASLRRTLLAGDALAVLDALGIERAGLVALSRRCRPGAGARGRAPERVTPLAFIGAAVPLGPSPERCADFDAELAEYEGWDRFNRHAWRRDFDGFCEWFFGVVFPEPHSTRQIESGCRMGCGHGRRDAGQDDRRAGAERGADAESWRRRVRCPVLVMHGQTTIVICTRRAPELAARRAGGW